MGPDVADLHPLDLSCIISDAVQSYNGHFYVVAAILVVILAISTTEGVGVFNKNTNEVIVLQCNLNGTCKPKYNVEVAILEAYWTFNYN